MKGQEAEEGDRFNFGLFKKKRRIKKSKAIGFGEVEIKTANL